MKPSDPKRLHALDLVVSAVQHFSPSLYLLELSSPDHSPLPPCAPGQFVELHITDCDGVFLRRPISVYYSDEKVLGLLIRRAGKGTERLASASVGHVLNVLFPLGNTFSAPTGSTPLLIGGGVGVAPMLNLGRKLRSQGITPTFLLGGKEAASFPDLSLFRTEGPLHLTTEDGSLGEQGFVTQHSLLSTPHFSDVYVCGPTPMMKAVAAWAKKQGIPCEVSLENLMACGMGVCLCCVEPTVAGHKCVCTDGPVFPTSQLLWP